MGQAQRMGWRTALWTSSDPEAMTASQRSVFDAIEHVERYDFERFAEKGLAADVVFIDEMYLPDAFYWSARRFLDGLAEGALVAMDDMRERSMDAVDLVVNTELGLRSNAYQASESLLGERYCLIREGFENPRKELWPKDRSLISVLVMIGGTDPFGVAFDVLDALQALNDYSFAPMLICGDGRRFDVLRSKLSVFPEYRLEVGLNDYEMASRVETCSFGVIGCGSSMYEFGALNTPFVGMSVADNQERSARRIEDEWQLPVVRRKSGRVSAEELASAIRSLITSLEKGETACFSEVDLLGARRVMQRIESLVS